MKIVFATACKNRLQHIKETLPQNLRDNPDALFVLLDYNDDYGLADYIAFNYMEELGCRKLVYCRFNDSPVFQMSHSKNMAHRCGILEGADILVNLDADNFTGAGFSDYIRKQFIRTKDDPQDIFMWSRMMKGEMEKGISGRMAVTRNGFLISGGYDEKYETHSPDDKDFNVRLRRLGFCAQEIDSKYLRAINHNDKMRVREWPQFKGKPNYCEKDICPWSTVVNQGNIGCGTVYRNFSDTPIVLGRLPTRVFGIGLHKTATTSLHAAFGILGLKSGHWLNSHWSKAVWNEMTSAGKSPSLEKFYALSDLPFPVLFEQLDKSYPGSKFILTIRGEGDWIRSVGKHFSATHNQFVEVWNTDPFTHRIHKIIYGQKHFDREVFLKRYRRHNAEAMNYFKHRPDDLLVMNMTNGAGWKELCGFLKMPIPAVDYPVKFITAP